MIVRVTEIRRRFEEGKHAAAPVMSTAMTMPTISARIWPRMGSWIIRESPRISACSSRRIKNR